MKRCNTISLIATAVVLCFSLISYTACRKGDNTTATSSNPCPEGYTGPNCDILIDSCKVIVCQNGGTCANGKCNCPDGYEGSRCEILSSSKFFGYYAGGYQCNGSGVSDGLTISAGSSPLKIVIRMGTADINATFTSVNTFKIDNGSIQGVPIFGSGKFAGRELTMDFSFNGQVNCQYTGVKQ